MQCHKFTRSLLPGSSLPLVLSPLAITKQTQKVWWSVSWAEGLKLVTGFLFFPETQAAAGARRGAPGWSGNTQGEGVGAGGERGSAGLLLGHPRGKPGASGDLVTYSPM